MSKVAVYGLGRFGRFWARLLAERREVIAYSRSPERPTPPGVRRVGEEEALAAPVVFFCVAISAFEEVIRRSAPQLSADAVVFDTCSVKVHPATVMERWLPLGVEIIASHPMFGPDSGMHGVTGLPLIMCPVRVSQGVVDDWREFFSDVGLRVTTMTPDEHDREAAFTQGVTHYIGRILADMSLKSSDIGTLGYTKLLEIIEQTCNDPWQLFLDLQRYNPHTRPMRERLSRSIRRIMDSLDTSGPAHNNTAGADGD
jgi:prephenate dehydrogenase